VLSEAPRGLGCTVPVVGGFGGRGQLGSNKVGELHSVSVSKVT